MEYEILEMTLSYVLKHDNYHVLVVAEVEFVPENCVATALIFYLNFLHRVMYTYITYLEIYTKRLI